MKRLRRRLGQRPRLPVLTRAQSIALAFGLALVVLCTAFRIADPYKLRLARELVFDAYQRAAPRADSEFPCAWSISTRRRLRASANGPGPAANLPGW